MNIALVLKCIFVYYKNRFYFHNPHSDSETLISTLPNSSTIHTGREEKSLFALGNAAGPVNSFMRQEEKLKKVLLDCVTEADMDEIVNKLKLLAMRGNEQARNLLFAYDLD